MRILSAFVTVVGIPVACWWIGRKLLRQGQQLSDLEDSDAYHHGGIDAATKRAKAAWRRVEKSAERREDDDGTI